MIRKGLSISILIALIALFAVKLLLTQWSVSLVENCSVNLASMIGSGKTLQLSVLIDALVRSPRSRVWLSKRCITTWIFVVPTLSVRKW